MQTRKSVMVTSTALLLVCGGMAGLVLAPSRLPAGGTAHAASCAGSAVSSPTSGPVGAVIAVCGSGWSSIADGTPVSFGYSTDPNCASNNTIVPGGQQGTMQGGSFSGWFRWPLNTSLSTYTVCAFIATIAAPPANTYTVLSTSPPQVTIAPMQIQPGQLVTVKGYNYLPGGTFVSLVFQSAGGGNTQSFGSTVSDSNGSFSISKNIPGNAAGSEMIVANAGAGQQPTLSASVTFTVSHAATPTPQPTPTAQVPMTPTAMATSIPKTPTSVSGTTPVATQGTVQVQTPTVVITPNTTQNSAGATSAGNAPQASSPLPILLAAGALLIGLSALLIAARARKRRRRRAAELEEALAPKNGPSWEGGNGLLASYRNNAMNLAPVPPVPLNGRQMMSTNGGPTSVGPQSIAPPEPANVGAQFIAPAEPAVGEPLLQPVGAGTAATRPGAPTSTGSAASGTDALLEAKMRQAQMGLFALARPRAGAEDRPPS